MRDKWQVSVLTPVHNTSIELLERALESLKKQSFGFSKIQWVVALHNCDSDYRERAKALLSDAPNITVFEIEKEGSGVSFARNATLDRAEGEYLFFLDSDDELASDCVETVVHEMEKGKADTAVFSVQIVGIWEISSYYVDADPAEGAKVLEAGDPRIARGLGTAGFGLGSRCYRRELIVREGIRFDERINAGEDFMFSIHATARARRVCLLPHLCGYTYYAGIGMSRGLFVEDEIRRDNGGPWGRERKGTFLASLMAAGRSEGLDISNFMWMQLAQFGKLFFFSDLPQSARDNYIETIRPLADSLSEPLLERKEKQAEVEKCCAFVRALLKLPPAQRSRSGPEETRTGRDAVAVPADSEGMCQRRSRVNRKYGYFLDYETIPEAVLAYAESSATAVICGSESLTYRELISDAQRLARALNRSGTGKGDRVVLAMERSPRFITAFLGILYAGAAYVAMDLAWPIRRREYIIRDSGASLVLTDEGFQQLLASAQLSADECGEPSLPVLEGSDAFAVYYTSGSTGEPKGTVTHHQVFFHEAVPVEENICSFETMDKCETFLSAGNFAYGATACDIASCLLYGKTLVLATEAQRSNPSLLGRAMIEHHVDAMLGTPSMLLMYLEDPEFARGFRALKRLIVTGEALSFKDGEKLSGRMDGTLFDAFGASEVRNYAFTRFVPGKEIRVEASVYGAKILLLDEEGRLVSKGVKGEVCIGGIPAEYGFYLGREELTAQKFKETQDFGRIYRTGDMAVREADGRLRMTGREDHLIKFHGQRVELGEVELCMEQYPGVKRAAAAVRGSGKNAELWAWYTADQGLEIGSLRSFLEEKLPAYMIPSRMQELKAFPLNGNGKLDRKALPEIKKTKARYIAPGMAEEEKLCLAFETILETEERVGVEDHFFLLGGDSLKAMRLIRYLYDSYGYTVTLPDIFQHPTPGKLSGVLRPDKGCEHGNDLPPANEIPLSQIPEELKERLSDPDIEAILPVSQSTSLYLMMKRYRIEDQRNVNRVRVKLKCVWSEEEYKTRVGRLVQNHPALRSEYSEIRGSGFWQIIYRHKEAPAFYKDLSGLSGEIAERFVNGFWQALEEGDALFETAYFVLPDRRSVLLIRADHTVADGMSLTTIQNELTDSSVYPHRPDEYILHRKRALTVAKKVPEEVRDYYRHGEPSLPPAWPSGKPGAVGHAVTFDFSAEETKRLSDRCAEGGFTLHTWIQLVYGKTLLNLYGASELWLIHVDHGRHSEWGDELRIVGNLMTGIPVRINREMEGSELQKILLRLRQFPGLSDSSIFAKINYRRLIDGVISQDFGPLNPIISESTMPELQEVRGNAMKIRDGALQIIVKETGVCSSPEMAGRFQEVFLKQLKSEISVF